MTQMDTTEAYIPGVCNINSVEIARRRKVGYIGLAVFVILLALFLALPISRWVRILLFFPAAMAANGFLQAKNHFCVGYASKGLQNATEGSKSAAQVVEQEALAKDKQRAQQMNVQSVGIGLLVMILTLLIPVLNK